MIGLSNVTCGIPRGCAATTSTVLPQLWCQVAISGVALDVDLRLTSPVHVSNFRRALSSRRAESGANYLAAHSVNANLLPTQGLSDASPVRTCLNHEFFTKPASTGISRTCSFALTQQ
jgi:hypothetical protein